MNDLYNAADPKQIRAALKRSKIVAGEHGVVVTNLMSSLAGRAWIYSLLETCHMWQTSFDSKPARMAFAEGERNVGLRILSVIVDVCPDQFLAMMREAKEKEDGRRSPTDRSGGDSPLDGWDPSDEPDSGSGGPESEWDPDPAA